MEKPHDGSSVLRLAAHHMGTVVKEGDGVPQPCHQKSPPTDSTQARKAGTDTFRASARRGYEKEHQQSAQMSEGFKDLLILEYTLTKIRQASWPDVVTSRFRAIVMAIV